LAPIDLGTEWRERRWRRLLNLIDELPGTSRTRVAMMEDEDLARSAADEAWANRKNKAEPIEEPPPSLRDWSPQMDVMAGQFDRIGQAIASIYAARGIRPPKLKPMKRPETAFERLMRQKRESEKKRVHQSIVAAVLGRDPE
jgi:hypothetical protein